MNKIVILGEQDLRETIRRMAMEIIEKNPAMEDVVMVGIRTGGAFLAARLRKNIALLKVPEPPAGILDITLYRDDLPGKSHSPTVGRTDLPFSLDGKTVILVDDVLFTGRTIRAAMDALMDYGRPGKIQLAVLVDRGAGDRELPIRADYVGGIWKAAHVETVKVYLEEAGFEDHVTIEAKEAA